MYTYKATVIRIIDGDTVEVAIDVGFHITVTEKVRLARIDTAEIFRPSNDAEKQHGLAAKEFLENWILHKDVVVITSKTGKYGRYIAEIEYDGSNVVDTLIENEFQKKMRYL